MVLWRIDFPQCGLSGEFIHNHFSMQQPQKAPFAVDNCHKPAALKHGVPV